MRALVGLVLAGIIALTAWAIGRAIPHLIGDELGLMLAVMLAFVGVTSVAVAISDHLERRADRRRPPVVQLAEAPRRIRQGRP